MLTTSRRLPPDSSRLACSYSVKRLRTASTRLRSVRGSSSVWAMYSLSSFSRLALSSRACRWPSSASIDCSSSSMRAEICSSFFISGWIFCVRIDNSSTRVTHLRRRMRSTRRNRSFSSSSTRGSANCSKSAWFCSIRCSRVRRLCGIRAMILSFSRFSVSETLMVRSNGNAPLATLPRVSTTWNSAPSHSSTLRRKRLRVTSIFLARAISCSRFSSGMLPICVRYIRTGSSMRRVSSSSRKPRSISPLSSSPVWVLASRSSTSDSSMSWMSWLSSSKRSWSILSGLASSSGK